jgi:hypothetical protein
VRSTVIFVCLAVFILLRAADPLICPDGCTDRPDEQTTSVPGHESTKTTGDCLLCTGGLASPVVVPVMMPFVEAAVVRDFDAATMSRPAPQLEHPPRLA